jgi:ATP-dependent RNA helicase DDX31/DBP7
VPAPRAAASSSIARRASQEDSARASSAGILATESSRFRGLGLAEKLCAHLDSIGFTSPTVVQSRALPALITTTPPRDCLVKSATGSGKTLAYLLPILQHLAAGPDAAGIERWARDAGTKALVLSPTRELALQIEMVWKQIAKPYYWIIASTILGGENKKAEKARLRKGVHVVIGTPGRVFDHVETTKAWSLAGVRWFVLDEADRLMDLGFEETVSGIFESVDSLARKSRVDPADKRRNVLVSATLGAGTVVERMAQKMLVNPLKIGFDDEDDDGDAADEAIAADAAGAAAAGGASVGSPTGPKTAVETIDGDDDEDDEEWHASDESSDDSDDDGASGQKSSRAKRAAAAAAEAEAAAAVHATPTTLQQLYVAMSSRHRLVALASFLRLRTVVAKAKGVPFKAIVFISTCAGVEFLHKILSHTFWPDMESGRAQIQGLADDDNGTNLKRHAAAAAAAAAATVAASSSGKDAKARSAPHRAGGAPAETAAPVREPLINAPLWKLHGNLPQKTRTQTYFEFCAASEGVMFCTDVAARGLDLPAVDWIIQFDAPEDVDDYVHRVGRTARFGRHGQAVIFLVESELEYVSVLLKKSIQLTPCPLERVLGGLHVGLTPAQLAKMTALHATEANGGRLPAGAVLQKQLEAMVAVNPDLASLAREAYMSFLRAYSAYPKVLKPIFHPKRLHLGEVAHSFALLETPKGMGKKAAEVHEQTLAVINPLAAAKAKEEAAKAAKKKSTLGSMSRRADARADVQEFM